MVEQNPGPPKYPSAREGFMPNMSNTRDRASSQSTVGVNESGDLGIARRWSFTVEGTSVTQLLTAIRADMNKHMTDIQGVLKNRASFHTGSVFSVFLQTKIKDTLLSTKDLSTNAVYYKVFEN